MIKAIIIDDEEMAREIVADYLSNYHEIEIIDLCSDGFSGLKSIQDNKPDLVFLDIQMPKLTGFEMLEVLSEKPQVIFTTAYDQYAIKAFEMSAIDYLLKPFSEKRFREAVDKALARMKQGFAAEDTDKLVRELEDKDDVLHRVVVRSRNEIHMIPSEEIVYIEAQDDYVMLYLKKEKFLKQKTMKYFERHLDKNDFARVHRSYIVKLDQISRIENYDTTSGKIRLKDGRVVPASRSGLRRLKDLLDI